MLHRNESFNQLSNLVEKGKLEIIWELSLPRSNSTALQIALCEAPEIHGQINEPSFHADLKSRRFLSVPEAGDRSAEDYFKRILNRVVELSSRYSDSPVRLVVNDLVHSVNQEECKAILQLTDKIAVTIRDPRIQGHSALTRTINDALDSPGGGNISPKMALYLANKQEFSEEELKNINGPGKDKINPQCVLRFLNLSETTPLTSSILLTAIKKSVERCCTDYLDICWENLKQQFTTIKQLANPEIKLIIIDGSDLTAHPDAIMRQFVGAFDLTYTPDMVYNWKKGNKENFYCCITQGWGELATTNHWNGPVRNSTRIEIKPNSITDTPEIESFPLSMRSSLQKALIDYQQFVSETIKPVTLIEKEKKDVRIPATDYRSLLAAVASLASMSIAFKTFNTLNAVKLVKIQRSTISIPELKENYRLFKTSKNEFLDRYRHRDPEIQEEYDKNFGLTVYHRK